VHIPTLVAYDFYTVSLACFKQFNLEEPSWHMAPFLSKIKNTALYSKVETL
jgi:hypothetical protein